MAEKKARKARKTYDLEPLVKKCLQAYNQSSVRAFAKEIGVPPETVQSWTEGKGSSVALCLLETLIKNKRLEEEKDALMLLLKDK